MILKHRCEICKRDMSIDLELFHKDIRTTFVHSVISGNGRWCCKCRRQFKLGEYHE